MEKVVEIEKVPQGYDGVAEKCPYCVANKHKHKMIQAGASKSCLTCGKTWEDWQLKYAYSKALERRDRVEVNRLKEIEDAVKARGSKQK